MSKIQPFSALRYNTRSESDLSDRLAPPYDVLDERDKAALLAKDPCNFVKIDLPHTPPTSAGPESVYAGARGIMDAWLKEGVIVRDSQPALYPNHQEFSYHGQTYVRKMFFARLRLEPFGSGSVFPHEKTFGGPKEDRLALMKATGAQLSPIFGLYPDRANEISRRLESALPPQPIATGTLGGVQNRLWAVTDPAPINDVTRLMADKPTFIADGHHRYGTALLYREWLEARQGKLAPDHPANFVLCVFCAMEDAGLLILPTHRVLPGVAISAESFKGDANVKLTRLDARTADAALAELTPLGPQAVGLYSAAEKSYVALTPVRSDLLDPFEPDHSPAWRRLGLAFLHAYLLDRVISPKLTGGKAPEIRYIKSNDDAVKAADETRGSAFLLQPTTMEEMRSVCSANDLMPQKSTFFYPKLASGLVISELR